MRLVLQIIFLIFGVAEVLTNGCYLSSQNATRLGRKQHSELPKTASDKDVISKVTRMLIIGVISLVSATGSILYLPNILLIAPFAMVLFTAYEAFRFKYWKIYCEFALVILLAGVTLLVFM